MANPPLDQTAIKQKVTLPRDSNAVAIQLAPAKVALDETYDATISASTEITLNASTTYIEVTAIDKAICMKWGTTDASTTDWDHMIPANWMQGFVVPIDTSTGEFYTAVNFIEESATAKLGVSEF